jgi:hypothetical protein
MPASIIIGRGFREVFDSTGFVLDVLPVDGRYEYAHRSAVKRAIETCAANDIGSGEWPVYDCGLCACVPLDDAVAKSRRMELRIETLSKCNETAENKFLTIVIRALRDGCDFFVVL